MVYTPGVGGSFRGNMDLKLIEQGWKKAARTGNHLTEGWLKEVDGMRVLL